MNFAKLARAVNENHRIKVSRRRARGERSFFRFMFNDALTIVLNFNGKTRLCVDFRFPISSKKKKRRKKEKLHAATKNRAFRREIKHIEKVQRKMFSADSDSRS